MDLDDLKNTVSNLTLYDIKAAYRKAQNAVMNYTEMESKVREATNNEPWGASSSLMQEIANGTFNYASLSEIMPMIYKRFTEKSAEEWRQIYKSLQLLEFLIKNGSERVIDDARSHMSLLKMLRQFQYVDMNGKDQGINVRNRAKELTELLSDVDRIRAERKKARQTRSKYTGVEGGSGVGLGGPRYGGFGSETGGSAGYGGYSGGVYGDGGGFGGESTEHSTTQAHRDRFEEYDEYDEGAVAAPGRRQVDRSDRNKPPPPKKEPAPAPVPDIIDFGDDDDDFGGPAPMSAAPASNGNALDDDFDDFQSATASTPAASSSAQIMGGFQSATISPPPKSTTMIAPPSAPAPNYSSFSIAPPSQPVASPPAQQAAPQMNMNINQAKPSGYQASAPNYFGSISTATSGTGASTPGAVTTPGARSSAMSPGLSTTSSTSLGNAAAKKPASGGDPFASLVSGGANKSAGAQKGPTMADMAKQKASAGIWGTSGSGNGSGGGNLI